MKKLVILVALIMLLMPTPAYAEVETCFEGIHGEGQICITHPYPLVCVWREDIYGLYAGYYCVADETNQVDENPVCNIVNVEVNGDLAIGSVMLNLKIWFTGKCENVRLVQKSPNTKAFSDYFDVNGTDGYAEVTIVGEVPDSYEGAKLYLQFPDTLVPLGSVDQ